MADIPCWSGARWGRKMGTRKSCSCSGCVGYCSHIPGRFIPGEIENVAVGLGLSRKELFSQYLTVDYYFFGDVETFVLRPRIVHETGGKVADFNTHPGRCVFLTPDNLCQIHDLGKPTECRLALHTDQGKEKTIIRRERRTAKAWCDHQGQIAKLLGRKPRTPKPTLEDAFDMLWDELRPKIDFSESGPTKTDIRDS